MAPHPAIKEPAMPRVSREQTDKNRIAIEEASSRLFREQGLHQVSVAELMGAAGLTHGGFYGHFESKDALAAAACATGCAQSERRWQRRLAESGSLQEAHAGLVEHYLGPRHRDHPGQGCTVSALAADVAREGPEKPVHAVYLEGARALLARLYQVGEASEEGARRQAALVEMATLVGALTLARATAGDPLSEDILDACRAALLGSGNPDSAPAAKK
jgi:TetR/AcrR family transcriptional repressor of nem operon